jgi:hypothetical protein
MTLHFHRAFDKVVASQQRLRLLPECEPTDPDVTITWSDEDLEVDPVPGALVWHRKPSGYVVEAPHARILVRVDSAGRHLVVHPGQRQLDLAEVGLPSIPQALLGTPRLAADTIVTNVLTALPALWGRVTVHSAALETDAGVVMLCARTGWGKTTVSQWLGRRGWTVLDDDSSTVELTASGLRIVPMGARARVRADAADRLGVTGEPLPGYAGGKRAMSTGDSRPRDHVAATVHLVQLPEDSDGPDLAIEPIPATTALVSLSRSMMVIDRQDPQARALRVHTAQALTQAPAFSVVYRREAVHPDDVAAGIQSAVQG